MQLSDLQDTGGIVSRDPVPVEIDWRAVDAETGEFVPKKYRVFVVQPSFGDIETMALEGNGTRKAAQVATVAACIRLGDNAEIQLTYEQAFTLHPQLFMRMLDAINAAGVVPKKPGRSPAPTRFGTSSSSRASAGGQSGKRKRG